MFKTRSTTYYTDADHGEFELPFPGDFYRKTLQVSADGLTAKLGMLCQDEDAEDPFDGDEGEFYQFDRSRIHDRNRPDLEEWKRIIRANPGRVFAHNGTGNWHGPGTVRCFPTAGPFTTKDCRGKKGSRGEDCPAAEALDDMDGYYIAPEDVTDPAKYAKGALKTYSAWCNGDVYGVCVWTYTRPDTDSPWELQDRDECWGYIGTDYAEEELNSRMKEDHTK